MVHVHEVKAGTMNRISCCESHVIDEMRTISTEFFQRVLSLPLDACLLTDESELADFFGAGSPSGDWAGISDYTQARVAWNLWVVAQVKDMYGIELADPYVPLTQLFERIREAQAPITWH